MVDSCPLPALNGTPNSRFMPAPWCARTIPSIYTYAQNTYWNQGLFRYWTVAQIPNFVIAAPVLALMFSFAWWYIRHALVPHFRRIISTRSQEMASVPNQVRPEHLADMRAPKAVFLDPSLAPHAIHTLILAFVFLFASHVQTTLRLVAGMPFLHWGAAWLIMNDRYSARPTSREDGSKERKHPNWRWGRVWVVWSMVWGVLSIVLWVAFLPPA
jgi:GPI mannosyltransferase 2